MSEPLHVYLAGAMEHAPDRGCGWRAEMEAFLTGRLGHRVFNPCHWEDKFLPPAERARLHSTKRQDLPQFRQLIRRIIDGDLRMLVNEIDYVICLWDEHVLNGGGTHGELTLAYYHNIPVYMVSPLPQTRISSWILGCTTAFFADFEHLRAFLVENFLKK